MAFIPVGNSFHDAEKTRVNLNPGDHVTAYIKPELHKDQPADVMYFHGKRGLVREVHANSILVELQGARVYLHSSECIKEAG